LLCLWMVFDKDSLIRVKEEISINKVLKTVNNN